ncbi:MAG: calcium/sodium antiporter [Oscillospiraceae bacterium]|nr:calcium/sodium antiporter [Oscillospiraceae bacterium]
MGFALNIILSAAGLALLIKCADVFVEGSASFARNIKVPTTVIGLTIMAFGTSSAEMAISFSSRLKGNTDVMFGSIIGSSISNIFVILAIAVLITPFSIRNEIIRKQIPIMMLVVLSFSVMFLDTLFDSAAVNMLSRADSIVLLLIFCIFVYYLMTIIHKKKAAGQVDEPPKYKVFRSIVMVVLGLGGVILGSELLVENLVEIASFIGISDKIITITIIAIGTSSPELVTTVVAAKKGENDIAIGNIIGTQIFNICVVLGLPVIIFGEVDTLSYNVVDISFMILAVGMLWIFSAAGRRLRRFEALIFIAMYGVYAAYAVMQ